MKGSCPFSKIIFSHTGAESSARTEDSIGGKKAWQTIEITDSITENAERCVSSVWIKHRILTTRIPLSSKGIFQSAVKSFLAGRREYVRSIKDA